MPDIVDEMDERMKRMRERLARNRMIWIELYEREAFTPSFPPELSYRSYPARSPSGSLLTHAELICSGPNYHLIEHAADGTTWLSVHEKMPLEHDLI